MAGDILIVDDEADIREIVAEILEDEGFEGRKAGSAEQALAAVAERRPSLVLLDIWLEGSGMDGLEVLARLKAQHPDLPVVMFSGHGNIETAVEAIRRGAFDFIEKPFETDRLLHVVSRAIEVASLARENRELRLRGAAESELIGTSAGMEQVRSQLERVAPTNSRVLISGPPGAGKEVAARMLHLASRRAAAPFVVLNAATMAPERMEVELFGVDPDAPSNGEAGKVGVFEQAHGGTLLLDEVADMPLETQGKILRVLVDQRFVRVGGTQKVQVDVRVVSATNRDLEKEVREGRFRQDLYHRLNVVPIRMPGLRQRAEDIPDLVAHFMQKASRSLGLPIRELGAEVVAALQTHAWPGNVRQLRNVIERMLIMAPDGNGGRLTADMLPPDILEDSPSALSAVNGEDVLSLSLREAREVFEREYLMTQISRFGGNISRTAEFVGMERSALHRKLKSLGLAGRAEVAG